MGEKVCVKWIEDKCVKWETSEDGGLVLNLKTCPVKLRNVIKEQLKKGFEVKSPLEQEPEETEKIKKK